MEAGDRLCLAALSYICSQSQREHTHSFKCTVDQIAGTGIVEDLLTQYNSRWLNKEKLTLSSNIEVLWKNHWIKCKFLPGPPLTCLCDFYYNSLCMRAQGTVSPLFRALGALCLPILLNPWFLQALHILKKQTNNYRETCGGAPSMHPNNLGNGEKVKVIGSPPQNQHKTFPVAQHGRKQSCQTNYCPWCICSCMTVK